MIIDRTKYKMEEKENVLQKGWVAYSLWGLLLKYNPVSKMAVFGFMNPMFGVLLSAVLLKEQNQAFTLRGLVSLVLVCIGIYVVNQDFSAKKKTV